MGHLPPCAIDLKAYHPPIYLQCIWILGMSTELRHVISIDRSPLYLESNSVPHFGGGGKAEAAQVRGNPPGFLMAMHVFEACVHHRLKWVLSP